MRKILEKCPACGGDLAVTRLRCGQCATEIHGLFGGTVFNRLSPANLAFAEMFVRLRGNIKEMERELGVPYNTVRGQLDQVIQEMGFGSEEHDPAPSGGATEAGAARREILEQLDRGEIGADEAARLLGRLR